MNYKNIHIGEMIKVLVTERSIELPRICNFFDCIEEDIVKMYNSECIDTNTLLKWSKLLEYDFFRIYSQHLILFAPFKTNNTKSEPKISLPQFRKNLYTKEIIDFVLERLANGKMTKEEIIQSYKIPKTTLYKWIKKYNK